MVNSNSKSRSAVENSSDAPTPNIYKYRSEERRVGKEC